MSLSKLKTTMKDFRDLLISLAAVITCILTALAYFTPASAFNKHIAEGDIEKLSTQRWEASKQMSYCVRQLQDYGSLTIIETQACSDAEKHYVYTTELLCTKYQMFCREGN